MLAQFDPYPLGEHKEHREVVFKLGNEGLKSPIHATDASVAILGTRKRRLDTPFLTFVGFSTDHQGAKRRVSGKFNFQTRKGSLNFTGTVE